MVYGSLMKGTKDKTSSSGSSSNSNTYYILCLADSQSFGSSPNYNTAHYTTLSPMSSSGEMPTLVSSSEDEEGGGVKPRTKPSDSGCEGSAEQPLLVPGG